MRTADFTRGEQQVRLEALKKRRLLRRWVIPIGLVLGSVLVFLLLQALRPAPEKKQPVIQSLLVSTEPVKIETGQLNISSQGMVIPRTETRVVAEVSGKIVNVAADLLAGGFFHKGEILFEIDPSDYQVALKRSGSILAANHAKLAREIARAEQGLKDWQKLDRRRNDRPSDLVLRKPQLAEAEAAVVFAEAEVEKARRDLERSRIRAPYDALVREKNADLGQYVNVGAVLGRIVAIDYAEVRLPLTNEDMVFLYRRQGVLADQLEVPVRLSIGIGDETLYWDGQIVRSEGFINVRTRMQYLVARIADPYRKQSADGGMPLRFGQFVQAEIQGPIADNMVRLPRHLLRDDDTVLVVRVAGKLHIAPVQVWREDGGFAYLSSGLRIGDQIIRTVIEFPIEGMGLRVAGDQNTVAGND